MLCKNCHAEINYDSNFCSCCGQRLKEPVPKEPGEIKIILNKVRDLLLDKKNKMPSGIGLTLALYIPITLQWCLGEISDEKYLELFKVPDELKDKNQI